MDGPTGLRATEFYAVQRTDAALVPVEQPLRLRIVRLKHVISERPRGRDAAGVDDLAKIALAEQGRAIDLRVAADVVMKRRRERSHLTAGCEAGIERHAPVNE